MSVVFVTGTDTGVGKTVATAALVVTLWRTGRTPYVYKPAQTGIEDDAADLDTVRTLVGEVAGSDGVRLRHPLAPDTAARLEGVTLPDLCAQRDAVLGAAADHDVVVEGAGGVLVHLGEHWTLLDLAEAVQHAGTPVEFVVVARPGLGTLNHSALTVDAITRRGLYVAGLVIGSWPEAPDLAMRQNLVDLPDVTGVPVIGSIPDGAGSLDQPSFVAAAGDWITLAD